MFTTLLLAPFAFTRHGSELRSLSGRDLLVACASGLALAVLLDERIGRRTVVGIVVALAGMAVMSGGELLAGGAVAGRRPLYGDGLAVLGAVMVAAYYPAREWVLFLGMAVGPGVFGHTVINWSLAHLESSVVRSSSPAST